MNGPFEMQVMQGGGCAAHAPGLGRLATDFTHMNEKDPS
jgi:hypothetical protein